MFIDHIRILAQAGDGGDGAVSFRREKFIPRGGPDGGDGGKGGDVVLRVDPHIDNLRPFFYNPNLKAEHGAKGGFRLRSGRSGEDLVVLVPQGTLVYRDKTADVPADDGAADASGDDFLVDEEEGGETEEAATVRRSLKERIDAGHELELAADLTEIGQEFILCRGGKGGKGNNNFKTPTHRVPYEFTPGEEGEGGHFYFELRQIADAGFGFSQCGEEFTAHAAERGSSESGGLSVHDTASDGGRHRVPRVQARGRSGHSRADRRRAREHRAGA